MERFNFEINVRVLVPVRRLIYAMEKKGLLDKLQMDETRAFGYVLQPAVQYGLEMLQDAWNEHRRCAPVNMPNWMGGIPNQIARDRPAPRPPARLPPAWDGIKAYEMTTQRPLRRQPKHAEMRDALTGQPTRSWQQRERAVARIMGNDMHTVWKELLDGTYGRIIRAYRCFLSFQ